MPSLETVLRNVGDISLRQRVRAVLDFLLLTDRDRVLDAGCGDGFFIMVMAELYRASLVGLDIDPALIAQARRWLGNRSGARLVVGDLCRLPFADRSFTKAVCAEVLEHLPRPRAALAELWRVLQPGGLLAVTVPHRNYPFWWDPLNWVRERWSGEHFSAESRWWGGLWAGHLRLYRAQDLRKELEDSGFQVEEMRALTRVCLPFSHWLLCAGRQACQRWPLPAAWRTGLEKFEWRRAAGEGSRPARWALRAGWAVLRAIDRRNSRREPWGGAAVHLAAKARKPALG